jgi:dienelactone hydrolase
MSAHIPSALRMAEVLLFHHAHGITPGFLSFAAELRGAGHVVHTPDLYEGKTFAELSDGVANARQIGFGTLIDRGRTAAEALQNQIVYAGFSLGGLPAQALAQTRPGATGALLFHSCLPTSEFSPAWPEGVPVQIHLMEDDPWAQEGDLDAARELVASTSNAELFLYPGDRHLFADNSLADYDASAAALLTHRVLNFLDRIDRPRT